MLGILAKGFGKGLLLAGVTLNLFALFAGPDVDPLRLYPLLAVAAVSLLSASAIRLWFPGE